MHSTVDIGKSSGEKLVELTGVGGGEVTEKLVQDHVEPTMLLLTLVDLSTMWLLKVRARPRTDLPHRSVRNSKLAVPEAG
jgi:hypothetical protein